MSKCTACLLPFNPPSLKYCLHIQVVHLPLVDSFFTSLITYLPDHMLTLSWKITQLDEKRSYTIIILSIISTLADGNLSLM